MESYYKFDVGSETDIFLHLMFIQWRRHQNLMFIQWVRYQYLMVLQWWRHQNLMFFQKWMLTILLKNLIQIPNYLLYFFPSFIFCFPLPNVISEYLIFSDTFFAMMIHNCGGMYLGGKVVGTKTNTNSIITDITTK